MDTRKLLEQARDLLDRTTNQGQGIERAKPDLVWKESREVIAAIDHHLKGEPEALQAAAQPVLGWPASQEPKYTTNGTHIVNRASGEVVPHDEPIFIFRARDKLACGTVGDYAQRCSNQEHCEAVMQRFIQFGEWADANPHRMKEPDTAAATPPKGEPQALQGAEGKMTAQRAAFFLWRFRNEEKLLGPNEQAALRFAIAALEREQYDAPTEAMQAAAQPVVNLPVGTKLPRHHFWGAGEPDCPADLKAPNGELHTMRCKICGDGWRKSKDVCLYALQRGPVGEAIDWVDDFIARCNGDDRGACEAVNVLRAALAATPPKGEQS